MGEHSTRPTVTNAVLLAMYRRYQMFGHTTPAPVLNPSTLVKTLQNTPAVETPKADKADDAAA